jgi:hypothetical protein
MTDAIVENLIGNRIEKALSYICMLVTANNVVLKPYIYRRYIENRHDFRVRY